MPWKFNPFTGKLDWAAATGPQGPAGADGASVVGPPGFDGTDGLDSFPIPGGVGTPGPAGPSVPGLDGLDGLDGLPGITGLAIATLPESAPQVIAAGDSIKVTDIAPVTPFTTAAAIVSTAVPLIGPGRGGQVAILRNDNGVAGRTLTIRDTNVAPTGSGLRLTADTLALADGSMLGLKYSVTLGAWVELFYIALKHYDGAITLFTVDALTALTHEWGDGSTPNDTAPVFVVAYTGIPSAASVTITVAPDAGYPLTLVSPYTGGTGAQYFRSATRNGTRTFRLSATVNGTPLTADVIVTYRAANYVGISTEDTALSAAQINALANVILDTDQYYAAGFAVNAGANDYVWCAFADSAGPYFTIGGERAGFTIKQNPFSHTTAYLKVANYYTYRSNIKNLGSVTVVTASSDGQVRNYYGVSTQAATLTSAQVVALAQSQLDTDAYYAWTSIASAANEYLWLAYPSSYTDPYFKETSTGERAGFTVKQTALAVTNQYGYVLAGGYDTARSDIVDMPTAAYTSTSTRPANRRHVGKVGQATQLSAAQILALQLSDLTESPNGTFASITGLGAGDYLWFCVSDANIAAPAHYGISPDAGASGYQEAAFTAVAVQSVTNPYGFTENFKDIHSNVTAFQAININNHMTATWSLKTQATAFLNRIYMGPHADAAITSAHILVLDDDANGSSVLAAAVAGSYNVTVGSGKYLWFCHPASISDLATIKDHATGFAVAGSYQANVSQTNDFGVTETYRCWRSDNANIFPSGGTVDVT
jgi:hypothetical protein